MDTILNQYLEKNPRRRQPIELFLNTLLQNPEALNTIVDKSMFFIEKHSIHNCARRNPNNMKEKIVTPGHENCEDEDIYSGDTEAEAENELAKAVHDILKKDPIYSFYKEQRRLDKQHLMCENGYCTDEDCEYCAEAANDDCAEAVEDDCDGC